MARRFSASAPGSIMLMGEHAVLWDAPCLVAAVDQRLNVILDARPDDRIQIHSLYGQEEFSLTDHLTSDKHRFVAATLQAYQGHLPGGFTLTVSSNVINGKGFGSSAAVIAATQLVLQQFCQLALSSLEQIVQGRTIVKQVQGYGSGADIAAATLGGIVAYEQQPLQAYTVAADIPLTAVFCGYKTPTADVLQIVEKHRQQQPEKFKQLTQQARSLVQAAEQSIVHKDVKQLGLLFQEYQHIMAEFGVEDDAARQALDFLRSQSNIHGAKISGSGLGDCVIACGLLDSSRELPEDLAARGMEIIPIKLTVDGVRHEPF